ncbi:MAG TPA: O-methyltransferase [Gemmatimonadaceae bacterium]|jgi:predicted O-methyltransferase YrrM|nr:O-methyltransferase [Gemmatimonadaceae bacterium]
MTATEPSVSPATTGVEKWIEVDKFFSDAFIGPDRVLESALESSRVAGLPPISVSPNQGRLLELLARTLDARSILEIGTLGGYSTNWLARGMRAGGRLITLEADPAHAAVARDNIARAGLESMVELRLGSASDTLPQISAEGLGPFDLIFIDADKKSIPLYFDWALRLSRPGGIIIVDNVVRDGRVVDSESDDPDIQGVRRFLEMVRENATVSGTAIQTVGLKGYDGFAIVRVVSDDKRQS